MRFDLDTNAPADKVQSLVKLAERYCVVYQTLKTPATLDLSVRTSRQPQYGFVFEGYSLPQNIALGQPINLG